MNVLSLRQLVLPLRSHLFHYMRSLSDAELRVAGTRNMIDFVWAAAKEPIENPCTFDRESLALALKYFNCTTLTIRLAGITHINVSRVSSLAFVSTPDLRSLCDVTAGAHQFVQRLRAGRLDERQRKVRCSSSN